MENANREFVGKKHIVGRAILELCIVSHSNISPYFIPEN